MRRPGGRMSITDSKRSVDAPGEGMTATADMGAFASESNGPDRTVLPPAGTGSGPPQAPVYGIRGILLLIVSAVAAVAIGLAALSLTSLVSLDRTINDIREMPVLVNAQRLADQLAFLDRHIRSWLMAGHDQDDERQRLAWERTAETLLENVATTWSDLVAAVRSTDGDVPVAGYFGRSIDELRQSKSELFALSDIHQFAQAERAAQNRHIEQLHARFLTALNAVERNTRAQAAVVLHTSLATSGDARTLEDRVDSFLEREMSWIATVYNLRSDAASLLRIVNSALATNDVETIEVLQQESRIPSLRLALARRLPDSDARQSLVGYSSQLVDAISGSRGFFTARIRELAAFENETDALRGFGDRATELLQGARDWVGTMSQYANSLVDEAQASIRQSQLDIVIFLSIGGVCVFVLMRQFLLRRVVSRLEVLESCMRSAAQEGTEAGLRAVQDKAAAIRSGAHDEISAMAGALITFVDAISERERDLVDSRRQAEEASHAKSQFLANMSHELRTPLNAVVGFAPLLIETEHAPERREYLTIIRDAGLSLLNLVQDVLDLSRIEAGKHNVRVEPFDLHYELQSVGRLFRGQAEEKRIALVVRIGSGVPEIVRGDAGLLRQVMINLVGNALKFTADGSVTISAEPDLAVGDRTAVAFEVSDTGIGIGPENLDRIFRMFEQEDNSFTRRYRGAGLGLAIVKSIVGLLGGAIQVRSTPGLGSCFSFTIPFDAVQRAEKTGGLAHTGQIGNVVLPPRPAARILVVEDDPGSQMLLKHILVEAGYEVQFLDDGGKAVDALAAGGFDLVLMDIQLPTIDGLEITRLVRSGQIMGCDPSLPIIAVTAYALAGDEARFLGRGMSDYLSKPIDPKILLAKIERVLLRLVADDPEIAGIEQGSAA